RVTFTEPVRGVAPGQAIVLYDGTRVVGSATIAATERAQPVAS
ncbi:aminomethyltransferase beta-barrel domain-containing protein, partial [Streptomyces asiaticus]